MEVNLGAGRRPLLHAEDVLRYKARGAEINKQAVTDLFKTVRAHPGVNSVAISHFALSSVASAPDVVEEISNTLNLNKRGDWLGGQTGIETGSPRMIKDHMMGKCKPFTPEDWPQVVVDAFEILSENSWVPVATMIMGLPGETEKDVDLSIDLVERLRPFKSLIVPLFLVSEGGFKDKAESFSMKKMTPKHSELFLKCWSHNLDWAEVFLNEFFLMKSGAKGRGMRILFSYAINQGKKLIRRCEEEYDFDIQAMIDDARSGRINVVPLPVRMFSKLLKPVVH